MTGQKKKGTVPRSPKFSTMSWQKKAFNEDPPKMYVYLSYFTENVGSDMYVCMYVCMHTSPAGDAKNINLSDKYYSELLKEVYMGNKQRRVSLGIYVCMYECLYVCAYLRMFICIYVCMYVCMYVYIYMYNVYLCMYVGIRISVCIYVCMHGCM